MPPPAEGLASRLIAGPTLRAQPDRRLVALVRNGYEVAFEEIVRRYAKPLGRYATAIVGGRSEDVTQDAFSKALVALRRDDAEIELRPWLYRIVRNTALNDLRDRPPSPEALAETVPGGRGPAEQVERREEIADLLRRLRALPEPQRAAIVMRELEGLSHEEIASALGLSGGAARQAIYRARQALREGAALLMPLPVVRLLLDHGTEMTAGAGAGGAAVAASASVGGASAGGALKLGALAAVLVSSVGTGIVLHENRGAQKAASAESGARQSATRARAPAQADFRASNEADDVAAASDGGAADGGEGNGTGAALQANDETQGDAADGSRRGPGPDHSPHRGEGQRHGLPDDPRRPSHEGLGDELHNGSNRGPGGPGRLDPAPEPYPDESPNRGPGGGDHSGPGGSGSDDPYGEGSYPEGGSQPPPPPPDGSGTSGSGDVESWSIGLAEPSGGTS